MAWLVSDRFWFLLLVQLAAGTAWAAYELAVFLICFNSIRAHERTSVLTVFNLCTTAGMVVGSLLGAAVLIGLGATRPVYYALFAGSSLLRLGTLFFLRRVPGRLIEPQTTSRIRTELSAAQVLPRRPLWSTLAQTPGEGDEWIDPTSEELSPAA